MKPSPLHRPFAAIFLCVAATAPAPPAAGAASGSLPAAGSTAFAKPADEAGSVRLIAYPAVVDLRDLESVRAKATSAGADASRTVTAGTVAASLSQGVHFDSIDSTERCADRTLEPPDPDIAVGPEHLVVAVNVSFEIYDTSGTSLVGPILLGTLFDALGGVCATSLSVFYPAPVYDEEANRFILVADGNRTQLCVAVSQTGDPTGAWHLYALSVEVLVDSFFDRPRAGIGRDAVYVGGIDAPGTGLVLAIDKSTLYAGNPTIMPGPSAPTRTPIRSTCTGRFLDRGRTTSCRSPTRRTPAP